MINKRFFISIYTQGGPPILLSLKPNVIEGVPLDLERALQVVKIVRDRILASNVPAASTGPSTIATSVPSPNASRTLPADPDPVDPPPTFPSAYEYDDFGESAVADQADSLLQKARSLIKEGKRQEAVSVLKEIVLHFPGSTEAGVARSSLEKAGISV